MVGLILGSRSHADLIEETLKIYGGDIENVVFIVGDNASVNKKTRPNFRPTFYWVCFPSIQFGSEKKYCIKNYCIKIIDEIIASKKAKKMIHFEWIPATSNVCERLFSRAKMIFDDYRKKLEPVNLEAQLFLFVNKQLWDIKVVSDLV